MKQSTKETSKPADTTVKPESKVKPKVNVASTSRGKEKIIYDSEEDEPDELELKQRKAREAEIDENQRIVKEAEEKEKSEREAQVTLESRKLLLPF